MGSNDAVVDAATIRELKGIMGEDFPLLVKTFEADSFQRLQALEAALGQQDAEAVRQVAHSFKGSAANLGAHRLADICQAIEAQGKAGDLSGLGNRFAELGPELHRVLRVLQEA